jgi:hypothetical protein
METNEVPAAIPAGLRQIVVGGRNRSRAMGVRDNRSRPKCGVFARTLILIPAAAASRLPDRACQAAMDVSDKLLFCFWSHVEDAPLAAFHERQTAHHVADLRFDHQNDGIVSQSRGGSEKQKEAGKAADGYAKICAHALAPGIVNFYAAAAHQLNADERLCGTKACAND